jgi:hypothetical protein
MKKFIFALLVIFIFNAFSHAGVQAETQIVQPEPSAAQLPAAPTALEKALTVVTPIMTVCDSQIKSGTELTTAEVIAGLNEYGTSTSLNRHVIKGQITRGEGKKAEKIRLIVTPSTGGSGLNVLVKAEKWEKGLQLVVIQNQCVVYGNYSNKKKGGKLFGSSNSENNNFLEAAMIQDYFEKLWATQ